MSIFPLFKNNKNHLSTSKNVYHGQKFGDRPALRRRLSYQVANLQGIGKRERQEDAFAFVNALDVTMIRKRGMLAIAADGMGGMADGKWAGETTVASIRASFTDMDMEGDICRQLEESVQKASDEVFERLRGAGGSTVVACVLYEDELYFASVGDSSLYLKRKNQIFKLNQEQNIKSRIYLEQIRSGILAPQEAKNTPEAATLTQFVGMKGFDTIDSTYRSLPLLDGDVILLCTDGVGGVLDEEKICRCLSKDLPAYTCNALENEIQRQSELYQDNYTALVINCGY